MRLPNGYGSVVKQSGKRRKPYVVRKSEIKEYCIIETDPRTLGIVSNCRFSTRYGGWAIECTDENKKALKRHSVPYRTEFKQAFRDLGYFETSKEAYTYLALVNNGNVPGDQKRFTDAPTFAEVFGKWHEWRDSFKTPMPNGTWNGYRVAFNRFSRIHERKFPTITVAEYQEIVSGYAHLSKTAVYDMGKVLHAMYRYAIANGIVEKDCSKFVRLEWTEAQQKKHIPFTDEEISKLWEHSDGRGIKMILIYIYTGMRPIELIQIRRENVHLDERYIIGGSKTAAGINRTIPIADKIFDFVKEFYDNGYEYLVTKPNGEPYNYDKMKVVFDKSLREIEIKHKPHDTRHTFITKMSLANVPESIVKRIVGHSLSENVTQDVYIHMPVEKMLEYVNRI